MITILNMFLSILGIIIFVDLCRDIIKMVADREHREVVCTFHYCNCYWRPVRGEEGLMFGMSVMTDECNMPMCMAIEGEIFDLRKINSINSEDNIFYECQN